MKIICCLYLLPGVIWDIKNRYLPGLYIWSGLLCMSVVALCRLVSKNRLPGDMILALLPGGLIYLLAKSSKNIGEGDAWLIVIMGCLLSFHELIKVLLLSFFLSAIGSMIFIICKRKMKNLKIPFVPFLFLGSVFYLLGELS